MAQELQTTTAVRLNGRLRLSCVLAVISGLATGSASAQGLTPLPDTDELIAEEELRRYSVEMRVFSYVDNAAADAELFFPDPDESATSIAGPDEFENAMLDASIPVFGDLPFIIAGDESAAAATATDDPEPDFGDEELVEVIAEDRIDLHIMLPEEFTLIDIHEKLVLLDAYEPVMWAGWTQGMLTEDETPFLKIRRLGNISLQFEGRVKFYLSRFLHLVIDIEMDGEAVSSATDVFATPFDDPFSPNQSNEDQANEFGDPLPNIFRPAPLRYRLVENRIVKSEELRYFDHPKFGVIAKITRYEPAPSEDAEEDSPWFEFPPAAAPETATVTEDQ